MPIIRGFRRFQSKNIVSSKQVVTQISNLVYGSNVDKSKSSFAAPFTTKRPLRKKVTIADRRAMLESFVKKYRAMNVGKFPPPTSAQKEVGGSYYLIKKMLQEMEYDFKISAVDKEPASVKADKKRTKREEDTTIPISKEISVESSASQQVSSSQTTVDQQIHEDPWLEESVNNLETKLESKDGLQPSTSTENNNITRDDTYNNIATESDDNKESECHAKPQNDVKVESLSEDNYSELNVEQQDDGLRNITREMAVESSGSQQVSSSQIIIDQQIYEDPCLEESVSNSDKKLELKEGFKPSISTGINNITRDDTHNNIAAKESHDRLKVQCHEKQEHNAKDESPSENNHSESKVKQQDDGIRNITRRDMKTEKQKDDESREKASSLWGNLKSLATDFINIWRK